MVGQSGGMYSRAQGMVSALSMALLMGLALVSLGAVALAAAGVLPWLEIAARWNGSDLPYAGAALQILIAALALSLVFYLPSHQRVARLERSHRNFHIGMEDVTRAYRTAHAADRAGVFALSGEFDTMRERMAHLRRHPDLGALEPEVLELAAQMSLQSRDLAQIYSDAKVTRAKAFLAQRQEEAQMMEEQIGLARAACDEIQTWLRDVEADERRLSEKFKLLDRDLRAVLPALGYELEDPREPNVVPMTKPQK
ncbi:DNA repair protein [Phaeovulum sp. W22_SRMD_FR3]|uniref:DNA repair protein n=1 Tax=Phaeovulum sp. W22_SRMD_FR3 TaxID=3240274 RepID=UPI003F9C804D